MTMPRVVARFACLLQALVLTLPVYAQPEPAAAPVPVPVPPTLEQMRAWVDQMKSAPRGPFERIRWFCADGAVLPPGEGVCREHGGGVQHGEWNTRAQTLRSEGYLVATLLADIRAENFTGPEARLDELRQILLEQFLITNDDGWVFRQARFYRGAIQVEDESVGASRLLLAMIADESWRNPARFPLLLEAARVLPVSGEPQTAAVARQTALEISDKDPGFLPLRIKIHGIPDATDPQRVRDYARARGRPELQEQYEALAVALDVLYEPQTAVRRLNKLAGDTRDADLKVQLQRTVKALNDASDNATRLKVAAHTASAWRTRLQKSNVYTPLNRLRLLLACLALEQEIYASGNRLIELEPDADRGTRLRWLQTMVVALHGTGLLSERQKLAAEQRIAALFAASSLSIEDYYSALQYLTRIPQWAQRTLEFHFGRTVEQWSVLTPLSAHFIPDRLRGSPLLAYARVLDTLVQDANALAGIRHQLFDREVISGLRALNPGLRRGVLLAPPGETEAFRRDGIYLLPSTTPELPPVAGILTRGEGSSLSHVQLLARNLGIPNVVISEELVTDISAHIGQPIVLAVSPRGAVKISADGPEWDAVFGRETSAEDVVIEPDLEKLDLAQRQPVALSEIRADDSGRTVGPKAANLGELAHNYPTAVNPGIAIPFGVFRALLDRPIEPDGPPAFEWLRTEYALARSIADPALQQKAVSDMLEKFRNWIIQSDLGEDFRIALRVAMLEIFGNDYDSIGLFVRSDTNVEDLPGFTGAGLNLTVPNVVGFDAVLRSIKQVWASPFTERAYAWRQAHMTQPEHVYPAVLLLKTFASEKSGVMVTADVESGDRRWLSIATSEGVGGAVEGQAAEELRVQRRTGEVRLLAHASAPLRSEPSASGGIVKLPASGRETLLEPAEIEQLRELADDVERRFPMPIAANGLRAPADIEFGFRDGTLALFQIRPFVESVRARRSEYLAAMDQPTQTLSDLGVDLKQLPLTETAP